MSQPSKQPLFPRQQWKNDTDPLFEALTERDNSRLHGIDELAWTHHIINRLKNRQFDKDDISNIINTFQTRRNELLLSGRSYCHDAIKFLLILQHAPNSDWTTRYNWKSKISDNRFNLESLLRNNRSMAPFVPAMIRYSWTSARSKAARELEVGLYLDPSIRNECLEAQKQIGKWKDRLPSTCPWTIQQIIGFSLNSHDGILSVDLALPFELPFSDG